MSSWFYVKAGERTGPANRAQLDALIAHGDVTGDTLVWRIGLSEWKAAGTLPELGLPPPLPPPPPRAAEVAVKPRGEAPSSPLVRSSLEPPLALAGFGVRLGAKLIDFVILWGLGSLVQLGVARIWFNGTVPLLTESWEEWLRFATIAAPINTAVAVLFSLFFILREEATPGKRLFGLRVVRADGGRLKAGRVIGRYFAEQLSGLLFLSGYLMAAFDEEKRTLHDYLCKTRVVKGPRMEQEL